MSLRPKPSVGLTRSRPCGVSWARVSIWAKSSISPKKRRALSSTRSPAGVRLIRRVVRLTSGRPARDNARYMLESFTSVGAPSVLPHLHGSKLAGLVVTQPQRSPSARDLPTLCEALGVMRDDDFVAWYVLLAPARRPPDAIAATEKAAFGMLKQAELHTKLAGLGTEPVAMPGEPFAEYMRANFRSNAETIQRFGIKAP